MHACLLGMGGRPKEALTSDSSQQLALHMAMDFPGEQH